MISISPAWGLFALATTLSLGLAGRAMAQTDEIQVYNAQIAAPGVINLTLHDNYTPEGQKTPAFPGAIVSNHDLNGVPEWAYGVTDWLEAGLYLPLYSVPGNGKAQLDGFKLRALFVEPNAARHKFFYGVNFEFSFNAKHWNADTYTQEIRPILGWRFGKADLILNSTTISQTSGRWPRRSMTTSASCAGFSLPTSRPISCSWSSTTPASRSTWKPALDLA
jgi:hypothetical protein